MVSPYDDHGHRTHVAGLVGSSGALSGGKYAGIAAAVKFVSFRVLDKNGKGRTSDVISALDDRDAPHRGACIENGRGNGVLEKLGASKEGLLRGAFTRNGVMHDQYLWSISKAAWMYQAKAVWGCSIH
jgi:subtilisin family serine protease